MPWGWECRSKLLKQVPLQPTKKRKPIGAELKTPGPGHYEVQPVVGGNGYSKIQRAPAYTFRDYTPASFAKPAINSLAPVLNVSGLYKKGKSKVTHGIMLTTAVPPKDRSRKPGPNVYLPCIPHKRAPAYSCQPPAPPPYVPWDMWTPSANMYCPPIIAKRPPCYTIGYPERKFKLPDFPGPGQHDPSFNLVEKRKPAFSFGAPFRTIKQMKSPAPNTYCEKKFMVPKRTIPAPSFGIRHSPKRGEQETYIKPSKLDLIVTSIS